MYKPKRYLFHARKDNIVIVKKNFRKTTFIRNDKLFGQKRSSNYNIAIILPRNELQLHFYIVKSNKSCMLVFIIVIQ